MTEQVILVNKKAESFSAWFKICFQRVFQKAFEQSNKELVSFS